MPCKAFIKDILKAVKYFASLFYFVSLLNVLYHVLFVTFYCLEDCCAFKSPL